MRMPMALVQTIPAGFAGASRSSTTHELKTLTSTRAGLAGTGVERVAVPAAEVSVELKVSGEEDSMQPGFAPTTARLSGRFMPLWACHDQPREEKAKVAGAAPASVSVKEPPATALPLPPIVGRPDEPMQVAGP